MTPGGDAIPAYETAIEAVERLCDELDAMHPLATMHGDRTRRITRDLRDLFHNQESAHNITAELLQEELDRQENG